MENVKGTECACEPNYKAGYEYQSMRNQELKEDKAHLIKALYFAARVLYDDLCDEEIEPQR